MTAAGDAESADGPERPQSEAVAIDPADDRTMADVLARAFWDDPVFEWLFPKESSRYAHAARFFRAEIRAVRRRGRVLTTPDLSGAGLWAEPGRWQNQPRDLLTAGPGLALGLGRRLPGAMRVLSTIERAHPRERHWYLAVLGTDPNRQGRGVGSTLIGSVLQTCDEEGLPAYLESSKESNVPFYRRHGFEVTDELSFPGSGPTFWLMWRDPRPPGS